MCKNIISTYNSIIIKPNDHSAVWRGQDSDDGTQCGDLEEEERRQTWQESQQSAAILWGGKPF